MVFKTRRWGSLKMKFKNLQQRKMFRNGKKAIKATSYVTFSVGKGQEKITKDKALEEILNSKCSS